MRQNRDIIWATLLLSSLCSGCDPITFVGAGAVVGASAAQERGLEGIASDTSISTKIKYLWLTQEPKLIDQVGLSVQAGCVVLTGIVDDAHLKSEALRLTRQVEGVTAIHDEIKVGQEGGWGDYVRDTWITTKLKATLVADENVRSRNYRLETIDKIVYLSGIAQDQHELDLVIAQAREIPNVRGVVSHVELKQNVKGLPNSELEEQKNTSASLGTQQPLTFPPHHIDTTPVPPIPKPGMVHQEPAQPLPLSSPQ